MVLGCNRVAMKSLVLRDVSRAPSASPTQQGCFGAVAGGILGSILFAIIGALAGFFTGIAFAHEGQQAPLVGVFTGLLGLGVGLLVGAGIGAISRSMASTTVAILCCSLVYGAAAVVLLMI